MQGKSKLLLRYLDQTLKRIITKDSSCLILGPRQVGKTSLVKAAILRHKPKMEYLLQNPGVRLALEADPVRLIREVQATEKKPLVFVDEAQKIPELFDAVQLLVDEKKAHFVLTGSSARKLRRSGMNLLPGRIQMLFLSPLLWGELGLLKGSTLEDLKMENINAKQSFSFEESLVFGSLPAITQLPMEDRGELLRSYTEVYLEEEIRAEALSRKIGAFSRFLELAATESGQNPNFTKLSNESGVSQPAIKEFYQVLEDTLIVERVDPYLKNARKRILASSRYYFFDLGVRNALARLPLTMDTVNAQKGTLFEHTVILEMIRRIRTLKKSYKIYFWRTSGGAEVDLIIDLGTSVIPIEIKAARSITGSDLKGLKSFLKEYSKQAKVGYVITLGERKEQLTDNIVAVPWFMI